MKNLKKIIAILGVLGIITASTAFAVVAKTPAEIVSSLTGKTITQLNAERVLGKNYGTIAKDAGKLEEFKVQMLLQKKAVLDQKVKDKVLTQAQADAIYNAIKANQATCDGTGSAAIGKKNGAGFGMGYGIGCGSGMRNGSGQGFYRAKGLCRGLR